MSSSREEIFSSSSFASTSNSLLRMAGGWGNINIIVGLPPGRTADGFRQTLSSSMIRTITSGTITSVFAGMTGSIISAMIYGTSAMPFLICSCAGFIVGAFGFYFDAVRKSMIYLGRYPRLLQLHMDSNFHHQAFWRWSPDRLRSSNFNTWNLRSMLVVGWLSAMPAIDNILEHEEQDIVNNQNLYLKEEAPSNE